MRKGQSSLEFLAMVSLSMLILASLYSLMAEKQQDTVKFQQDKNAEYVSEKVAFEVEMALVQGEGYSRVFSLPARIGGSNYSISVGSGEVFTQWGDSSLYRLSRYQGEEMVLNVDHESQVFRVKHNSSGVSIVEQ
ncbi:MAG: hypothetical protein ACI8Z7_000159 [Candidatus Nanohaloarchaea archaeon]|jgi:hypothetical protein